MLRALVVALRWRVACRKIICNPNVRMLLFESPHTGEASAARAAASFWMSRMRSQKRRQLIDNGDEWRVLRQTF